jgi:hypothetical protein
MSVCAVVEYISRARCPMAFGKVMVPTLSWTAVGNVGTDTGAACVPFCKMIGFADRRSTNMYLAERRPGLRSLPKMG